MSTFLPFRIRTLRLTAMRLVLIIAAADLVAGLAVILHQPSGRAPDPEAGKTAPVMMVAADSPPDTWHEIHQTISSSLARRSQFF